VKLGLIVKFFIFSDTRCMHLLLVRCTAELCHFLSKMFALHRAEIVWMLQSTVTHFVKLLCYFSS